MLSDPQFWVAIAFVIFLLAIFNPVRKILITSLDTKIEEIKNNIETAENIRSQTQN
jgi:F-type H+-transporting ATPase subunit b